MPKCKLTLYTTTNALPDAERELHAVLRSIGLDDFELETVDVSKDELRAKTDGVTDTPLVRTINQWGARRDFRSLAQVDDYELKYALGLRRLW